MSAFIGRLIEVGFGVENPSDRGNPVPAEKWIDKMNVTIEDKPEVAVDESTVGRIEDSINGKVVLEGAEGEISGKLHDISIGYLLLAAIGAIESSDPHSGDDDVFDNVFAVKNDAQHPSLTIEVKNPQEQLAFALAMLETLEIRAEIGKYVEYTATFKSKKGATATTKVGYDPENIFLAKHITLKMADTIGELSDGGVEPIPAKSVTIRITKNLERDDTFGSLDPADILNKQFSIEVTVVSLYRDLTFKTLYADAEKQAMLIDIKNTDVVLGIKETTNPELIFTLAQVLLTNWEKTSGPEDLSVQTITAKANYSLKEKKMLDCVLTNTQEGYPFPAS